MKVYLVQHAKPKPEEEDPQKPLSEQGEVEAQKVAEFAKNIKVNKIQHSGKLRAQQTAEILGKSLGVDVVKTDSLEPMADTQIWANRIEEHSEDVLLVGHLPHLAKLASQLLTQNQEKPVISFKQGGIICLEKTERGWQVAWMVTPDLL